MVATTSERLLTHFGMCRANQADGTAAMCVYPSYFTAARTAVVVWRGCCNDCCSKPVLLLSQLWGYSNTWEPYSTETVFTGTFLCPTESKRQINVVYYTGSLILSDNYLLPLPVGSFILLTSLLKCHTLVREGTGNTKDRCLVKLKPCITVLHAKSR